MPVSSLFRGSFPKLQSVSPVIDYVSQTKVLVIDDDQNFLFGISEVLKQANFDVVTANCPSYKILTDALRQKPELILLDVNLPFMTGFEVKQALDKNPMTQNIPVIFISARSDQFSIISGFNLGDDYIQKPIDADILVARIKAVLRKRDTAYKLAIMDLKLNNLTSIEDVEHWVQAVEVHDFGTAGHTARVTKMFAAFAKTFGFSDQELKHAIKGAMLHDIGKLAIPAEILNKPGSLSQSEWAIIRKHPEFGLKMLTSISMPLSVLEIPHFHHERWDGSGYPDGLIEEEIPLSVRIFSIVDVFDALKSKRPYRVALTDTEVLEILKSQRGKQFDPFLLDGFLGKLDDLKSIMETSDGENYFVN